MAPTAFTRYTVAPTTASRVSRFGLSLWCLLIGWRLCVAIALLHRKRRTSRSKRKMERKAGRKGTVDEEEYLLHSINKVVDKFNIALGMDDMIFKRPWMLIIFTSRWNASPSPTLVSILGGTPRRGDSSPARRRNFRGRTQSDPGGGMGAPHPYAWRKCCRKYGRLW